jgi:hypothetical protein
MAYLYRGYNEKLLREQYGVSNDDSIKPFLPDYIARLRQRPYWTDDIPPHVVFVRIDSAYVSFITSHSL